MNESLAAAYQDHGGAVYGVARGICGSRLADDVVQEVFVHVWRHPEKYDPARGTLRTFLLTVARSTAIDHLRSDSARRAREERSARTAVRAETTVDGPVLRQERDARVVRAINDLPARERDAIVMVFYGHLTYREAAVALRLPEGTVKSRIRSGLRRLRSRLIEAPSYA